MSVQNGAFRRTNERKKAGFLFDALHYVAITGLLWQHFIRTVSHFYCHFFSCCLNTYHQLHFSCEIIIRLLLSSTFLSSKRKTILVCNEIAAAICVQQKNETGQMIKRPMPMAFIVRLNLFVCLQRLPKNQCPSKIEPFGHKKVYKISFNSIVLNVNCVSPFSLLSHALGLYSIFVVYLFFFNFLMIFFLSFSIHSSKRQSTAKQTVSITAMTI